jgi:ketosteroid isomerase-like protein
MLKFIFTAFILFCFTANTVFSQNKKATTLDMDTANKAIQIQLRAFESSLKKGDSVALGNLYCTDARLLNHGSPSTIGRNDIVKVFGDMIRDSTTNSGFVTNGLWAGDEILVEEGTGYFAKSNGTVVSRGRYLLIWKREEGQWKIFRDTFFSDGKIKK